MKKTKGGIIIKGKKDIDKMFEGGKKLADIKARLKEVIKEDKSAADVEELANDLIEKAGGKPSFKMVKNYSWATCVNVNEGVVHGIPRNKIVFKKGDLVSVDVGFYYKGFHTDTSFSVAIRANNSLNNFLLYGKKALKAGILEAKAGNRVYDISEAIEKVLKEAGTSPIRALVGHGIGRRLHEEPPIPCFTAGKRSESPKLPKGAALAVEVMYSKGSSSVELGKDEWTISTSDGKIAALFEETVIVEKDGPIILTNRG